MLTYRTPGAYFEEADSAFSAAGPARTDIAGFVGIARRGPLHHPVKVESFNQFTSLFGDHLAQGYLAYAVEGFFSNGGRTCWVVRVADPAAAQPAWLRLLDGKGKGSLDLVASSPGVWGRRIRVTVRSRLHRFSLALEHTGGVRETWPDLTMRQGAVDLPDALGRPRLRLEASHPQLWRHEVTVTVHREAGAREFTLSLRPRIEAPESPVPGGAGEVTPGLPPETFRGLLDPSHTVRVLQGEDGARGSRLVRAVDLDARKNGETAQDGSGAEDLHRDFLKAGTWKIIPEPRNVARLLNHPRRGSRLVRVRHLADATGEANTPAGAPTVSGGRWLHDGEDGLATLSPAHFVGDPNNPDKRWGLRTLEAVEEVSLVCMPDVMPKPPAHEQRLKASPRCHLLKSEVPPPAQPPPEEAPIFQTQEVAALQHALIRHCEALRDRVAILDPRPADATADEVLAWRRGFDSSFAALYYPWALVRDPLRLNGRLLRPVPPCGHLAGVFARTDLAVGVHKAPANELLDGVRDVAVAVDEAGHGELNDAGVNVIRAYTSRGLRVMGARTLSHDPALRFLSVRRLLTLLVETLEEELQWVVLEPNRPDVWVLVEGIVRGFLESLWRRGMLDGASREEAYFVRCDETTNPPEEIDAGRLVCLVGILPPWPAEFVVIRIGQVEGRLDILDVEAGRG